VKYYINLLQICIDFPQGDDVRLAHKPSDAMRVTACAEMRVSGDCHCAPRCEARVS
jgi:hypothetical protein